MTTTPMTGRNRLPRYTRTQADVSLALTERDLRILKTVESYRLLTSEHVQALTPGSSQGILRRLQKLFHAGCLDRLRPRFAENGGSQKMVYAITNKGVAILQKEGVLKEVSTTDRNAQNRDLHEPFIRHRLLVSHIRAMFLLACQVKPKPNSKASSNSSSAPTPVLEFLFWREGREIQDTIEVALPQKYARLPVAADGFFGLRDAQGRRSHFFVEADRGTMTLERFTLKLKAYAAYYASKKHTDKFGIQKFRVLTVTSTEARCRNLVAAAQAAENVRQDGRLFLFATQEDLPLSSPESVLTKIWTVPGSQERCSLLGQAPSKNPAPKENNTPMPCTPNAHTEVSHGP